MEKNAIVRKFMETKQFIEHVFVSFKCYQHRQDSITDEWFNHQLQELIQIYEKLFKWWGMAIDWNFRRYCE
jgi:hypothetical protein